MTFMLGLTMIAVSCGSITTSVWEREAVDVDAVEALFCCC